MAWLASRVIDVWAVIADSTTRCSQLIHAQNFNVAPEQTGTPRLLTVHLITVCCGMWLQPTLLCDLRHLWKYLWYHSLYQSITGKVATILHCIQQSFFNLKRQHGWTGTRRRTYTGLRPALVKRPMSLSHTSKYWTQLVLGQFQKSRNSQSRSLPRDAL